MVGQFILMLNNVINELAAYYICSSKRHQDSLSFINIINHR